MSQPELRTVPLASLHPSPSNPRKTVREIDELAASIAEKGVLQPLLCRKRPGGGNGALEVVAGERRRRACEIAGVDEVPVMIGEFTDVEVLEIQIAENDQREDVHPLEEADGFAALRDRHGRSVDDIAARIGRPVEYVHRRLVLTQLGEVARRLLEKDEITIGVAEVLARIPNPKLQDKAAKDFGGRGETVRSARATVRLRYMLRLADAPWTIDDADLLAAAGPCTNCPKRTGAQAYLFPEIEKDDLCTDLACWDTKKAAAWKVRSAAATAAGRDVLPAVKAKELWPDPWSTVKNSFLDLDSRPDWQTSTPVRSILGTRVEAVPVTLAKNPHTGDIVELVRRTDVHRALLDEPRKSDPPSLTGKRSAGELSSTEKRERTRRHNEKLVSQAKAKAHEAAIVELVERIHSRALSVDVDAVLRWLADVELARSYDPTALAKTRGIEVVKKEKWGPTKSPALETFVAGAGRHQLIAFLLEVVVRSELTTYGLFAATSNPSPGQQILELFGVDWLALEKTALEELRAAEEAKIAKKKIAKKAAPKKAKKTAKRAPKKETVKGVCRECGCTEDAACPEGCAWADGTQTLCTACAGAA